MKIKSLILGSAAALLAASGARAADAIVMAEPEPVEYVRVCDAYGAGFFYIPGTETCLSISGYVWFQVATSSEVDSIFDTNGYYPSWHGYNGDSGWNVSTRARVNFDARSDTEWGTLRGFIRVQATWGATRVNANPAAAPVIGFAPSALPGDGAALIDQAFIELGGLRMGYSESAWAQSQGGGVSNWGSHSWGGMYYGYQQRHLIAYTFQGGNGFFGTISLEDDNFLGNCNLGVPVPPTLPWCAGDNNEGFLPDIVVKVGVNQGWGGVWAKVAYDESFDGSANIFSPLFVNSGGWAASVGTQINVPNMPGSSLRVIGYWADGAHAYNVGAPGIVAFSVPALIPPIFGGAGAEWSILASYNHAFSSTLSASVAFQWFNDYYIRGSDINTGIDGWGAEFSVVWFPVTNFEIRGEVHYDKVDFPDFNIPVPGFQNGDGMVSGFLRFTRYF